MKMKVNKTWLVILLLLVALMALVIVGVGMKQKQNAPEAVSTTEITSVSVIQPRTTIVSADTTKTKTTKSKTETSSKTETTKRTSTTKKTTTTVKTTVKQTTSQKSSGQSVKLYSVKKTNGQYTLYLGDKRASNFTGLLKIKIPELSDNAKYYYFTNGVYDRKYSGPSRVAENAVYWVDNGTWNKAYEGIVKYDGHRYIMTDGKIRFDFSGTANVDGKNYQVSNGMIVE